MSTGKPLVPRSSTWPATLTVGCAATLGLLISRLPVATAAGAIGAVTLLALRGPGIGGVLLGGAWPAYVLPPGLTAPITLALGLSLLMFLRVWNPARWRQHLRSESGVQLGLVAAFGLIALASSLPMSQVGAARFGIFAAVCLPCFLAGRLIAAAVLMRAVLFTSLPLLILGVIYGGNSFGHVNPISFGLIMALTAIAALLQVRSLTLRLLVVIPAVTLILGTGKLGPVVAFGAGAIYYAITIGRSRVDAGIRRRILFGLPIALTALWLLTQSYNEAVADAARNDISARSRIAVARYAFDEARVVGAGADALGAVRVDGRYVVRYAHNFVLDALIVSGILGALPIAILFAWALVRLWRLRDPAMAGFVCVIVAGLFSGGVLENWTMWLVLGACLRRVESRTDSSRHISLTTPPPPVTVRARRR